MIDRRRARHPLRRSPDAGSWSDQSTLSALTRTPDFDLNLDKLEGVKLVVDEGQLVRPDTCNVHPIQMSLIDTWARPEPKGSPSARGLPNVEAWKIFLGRLARRACSQSARWYNAKDPVRRVARWWRCRASVERARPAERHIFWRRAEASLRSSWRASLSPRPTSPLRAPQSTVSGELVAPGMQPEPEALRTIAHTRDCEGSSVHLASGIRPDTADGRSGRFSSINCR